MKTVSFIIISCFISCKSVNQNQQTNKKYYFYFDNRFENELMKKYHSWKDGPLNYLYKVDNDKIVFSPTNGGKILKRRFISIQDTADLDIKNFKWLNSFNNIQRDSIFLNKPNNIYYIIEKDTISGELYATKVLYIQETE